MGNESKENPGTKITDHAELAARRAVEVETAKFREFVERAAKYFGLGVGIASAVLGGIGVYFFGSSVKELRSVAESRIASVETTTNIKSSELAERIMSDDGIRARIRQFEETILSDSKTRIEKSVQLAVEDRLSKTTKDVIDKAALDKADAIRNAPIDKLFSSREFTPPGTIVAFGGVRAPDGWLLCDGRRVSKNDYSRLWSAVESTWGPADEATFTVPDLRGMFLRGAGPDRAIGSFQDCAIQKHGHKMMFFQRFMPKDLIHKDGTLVLNLPNGSEHKKSVTEPFEPDYVNSIEPSGDSETRPKNMAVNYIIKY